MSATPPPCETAEIAYYRKRYSLISQAIGRIPLPEGGVAPPIQYRRLLIEVRRDWVSAIERHYGNLSSAEKSRMMLEEAQLEDGIYIKRDWTILA